MIMDQIQAFDYFDDFDLKHDVANKMLIRETKRTNFTAPRLRA